MTDLYIKELERKVAHYETVMSRCPQCKTNLANPGIQSTSPSSRHSRSSHSVRQPAAKVPPPALTGPSNLPAPASKVFPSAQFPKQSQPTSRTELQETELPQPTSSILPPVSSKRLQQYSRASAATLQHPTRNISDHPTSGSATSLATDPSGQPTASPQTLPTRPSSSLALSTADGRHHHSGKLVQLDLQQYKKPRSRNPIGRSQGQSYWHAAWMRTADIMLEEVPAGRQWREKIMSMDSSTVAAVAIGVAQAPPADMSQKKDVELKELVQLVRRFAERHSQGRVNFEHFILVCLCRVLSSQGVPQSKIVETLQICISDTGKKNIDKYLKGASWANKLMNDLFFTEWGYRAVDLIAIWNRSIATYATVAGASESRQYFFTDLTQRKHFEGYREVPNRRHDTIAWIVKKELGNKMSYRDICEALGYSDEYIVKTRSLHASQPPSPEIHSDSSTYSHPREDSPETSPTRTSANALKLLEASLLRRQLQQDDDPDDSDAGEDSPTTEAVAPQRARRLIPDRTAKPLGDPDVVRRRGQPHDYSSLAELPFSTSLGESAPVTQSSKRPLPDSPTSAFQPVNTPRRRQHVREKSSREELGSPSNSGRQDSTNRRSRA